ncbi:MAG: GspH/FimT family pseudopilin [Pseudomonas sp.]|nr:GspH/FimT family pseudopilin [Pseudomonas sp.]
MQQHGFNLIQLMISLAIVATLLQLASPTFSRMLENHRREVLANELAAGLRAAKTEAVLRSQDVVIHALEGDWSAGWRIIVDLSGQGADDDSNPVLFVRNGKAAFKVVGNRPVQSHVRFTGMGWPRLDAGGFQAGSLHLCEAGEPFSHYRIVVAASGRIRIENKRAETALCADQRMSDQRANA